MGRDFRAGKCVEVATAAEEEPITRLTVPNIWVVGSCSGVVNGEI